MTLLVAVIATLVPPASGSGAGTDVRRVRPVTAAGDLKPAYTVVDQRSNASCITVSAAIGFAYRCFGGNFIYDPCWLESTAGPHVICLAKPWSHDVVRLHVTDGFDTLDPESDGWGRPWGIDTATGDRCLWLQGVSGFVGGRRVAYGCGGDLVLVGAVDRTDDGWRIRRAIDLGHGDYDPDGWARIAVAWKGKPSLPA